MTIKAIETEYNGYKFRSRTEAKWAVFFDALGVDYEYEPEGYELPNGERYLPDFRVKCYGTRGELHLPPDTEDWHGCRYCKFGGDDYDYQLECRNKNAKFDEDGMVSIETDDGVCMNCDWFVPENDGYPFDLYIEVKGKRMTEYDARRIKAFAGSPFNESGEWDDELASQMNPVLVVGNIPSIGCSSNSSAVGSYNRMDGIDIYPFNYELIDGDHFAAYPAARNGKFYLWGDDSNYINLLDVDKVEAAYDIARKARFEFGETPVIHHE